MNALTLCGLALLAEAAPMKHVAFMVMLVVDLKTVKKSTIMVAWLPASVYSSVLSLLGALLRQRASNLFLISIPV